MIDALKRLFAKKEYRYRSAITGKWVKAAYALANPATTVRVRIK